MIWSRRAWPLALLALPLLSACPADDEGSSADSNSMMGDSTNTSSETTMSGMTSTAGTAGTADDTASADGNVELGCAAGAVGETTDGAMNPVMETWGAACQSDQGCVDLLGDPDAICDTQAVVYELPGGYCTKPCTLPDADTRAVPDDPSCSADGGVACIGVMGVYERCGVICSDDNQCNRDGYICRALPMIGTDTDPTMCLMPDCCLDTCAEE